MALGALALEWGRVTLATLDTSRHYPRGKNVTSGGGLLKGKFWTLFDFEPTKEGRSFCRLALDFGQGYETAHLDPFCSPKTL